MTAPAESGQPALALELIRPFTESDDARLRGNAVVALTALIESPDETLKNPARDELVRVLCAEPGSHDVEWQRRFTAISVNAISQLPSADRQFIGSKVLETLAKSREPSQQAAIARMILAACDRGRLPWPIGWRQFRRYASLVGRPGYWPSVWAALWRVTIAVGLIMIGANMLDYISNGAQFADDNAGYDLLGLAVVAAVALGIVMKLLVPGNVRPPRRVRVTDTALDAVLLGLMIALLTLGTLPEAHHLRSDSEMTLVRVLVGLSGVFLIGLAIGVIVRGIRWASDVVVLEPEGYAHLLRPAVALGVSALACIAAARMGMDAELAAAAFLVTITVAPVLTSLDLWLAERGPRSSLPPDAQAERPWLLPLVAAVSVIGAAAFLFWNLHFLPPAPASKDAVDVGLSTDAVAASTMSGQTVPVRIAKDGDYSVTITGEDMSDERVLVQDDKGNQIIPPQSNYGLSYPLKAGSYLVCATGSSNNTCTGRRPKTLLNHVVAAFGLFDSVTVPVTLTFARAAGPNESRESTTEQSTGQSQN